MIDWAGRINVVLDHSEQDALFFSWPGEITPDQWHHICIVYNMYGGRQLRVFVDGRPIEWDTNDAGVGELLDDGDHPLYIGARSSQDRFFHGRMDEVMIFDKALTSEQIGLLQ